MKRLDKKKNLNAFPLSLMGGASKWYYSLDPSKTKVWNDDANLNRHALRPNKNIGILAQKN